MGLEPMTSSLPRKCSTTELQQHETGAGEGDRTLTTSLEGWGSTIELRPHLLALPGGSTIECLAA